MSEGRGVSAKAEELRAKRGTTKRASSEDDEARRARWREDKRKKRERELGVKPASAEREPYVAEPAAIMLSGMLGATIFNLAAKIGKHRELTDDERLKLGEALDPVLWKWLPVLGDWKSEAALVMVAFALWHDTTPAKETEDDGRSEGESVAADQAAGRSDFLRVQA